ncbi:MAG: formylglycine-generating enzyme family protein, partial [Candidatus Adiutrix sp.]|nr:formylglycine-generating enzyme family protein [Candidatus Adiutrix sp.]
TQEQWQTVMGSNPSNFRGQTNPVENVSWNDVQEFIRKLNQKEQKKEGHEYRLPTEAEWEYAARAGTKATYFFADDAKPLGNYALNTTLGNYAWYKMNSEGITHPVGGKKPNPWGLYDIYGNVWEWVQDWYAEYPAGAVTDPQGPSAGVDRVYRGGSWGQWSGFNNIEDCRSAYRGSLDPDNRGDFDLGFRLAFSPGQ